MATLNRDAFLANGVAFRRQEVAVPELGGTVYVRQISALERDQFERAVATRRGETENTRARLVILCAVDEKGDKLFGEDDEKALGALPVSVLEPIVTAAMHLNAMTADVLETARKNSAPTPAAASPAG
jgi:hypothetical protein